jgi:hypothetical protein
VDLKGHITMTDAATGTEQAAGIEPHLSLAFAMDSTPGAYALLLGAGLSITAGVPSAWRVQEELLLRLARAQGEAPDDPFAWYHQKYQKHSTYLVFRGFRWCLAWTDRGHTILRTAVQGWPTWRVVLLAGRAVHEVDHQPDRLGWVEPLLTD